MHVILYKRHRADCEYRADKTHRRCRCSVWFEWNLDGKQTRKSAKTASWEHAQQLARRIEQQHMDAALGLPPLPDAPKRVDEAIRLFTDSKRGEDLAANTLYKHKLTLDRLQSFCDDAGILYARDITLSHLTTWRASWPFTSPLAKRNNQERVKGFFKFCAAAGIIPADPTAQLTSIQVKFNEADSVRPFEPAEYKRILAAVPKSGMSPRNQARVRACMQLQRWSGLSLVDAVCLSTEELVCEGRGKNQTFRVRVERRKTGAHVNNVIPAQLGRELLKMKNGNPNFIFISGEATPKSAASIFDKLYRTVFKAAGVPGHSHQFRHTFSVELLKAGVDIRKVSKALGHSSVTITERYYAKWNRAQQDILDADLKTAW